MKALVYSGPRALDFRDVPDPAVGPETCLVRVDSVGICGSDMHAWLGHDERRPAPLILGHEAAGTVVSGSREGRRVTINPLVTCGACRDCLSGRTNICKDREIISMPPREGAFAEYVSAPKENLVPVPAGVLLERAALVEPLAVAWHAIRLAESMPYLNLDSARCLVLGGGAIGLGSAIRLQAAGAADVFVVEPNGPRRDVISRNTTLTVTSLEEIEPEEGEWNLVIDAVGSAKSRAQAFRNVRRGGVIVHVGLHSAEGGVDARRMTLGEITVVGTYTYTGKDFRDAANAVFAGVLGSLDWYEIRPLCDGKQAFEEIQNGAVAAPKIILKP